MALSPRPFWSNGYEKSSCMAKPNRRYIPLKYKFVAALLVIVLGACSAFFYSTYQTTYRDKQLFIRDLNLATLDAALSAITFELRMRVDDLQTISRRVYTRQVIGKNKDTKGLFRNLSSPLEEEILGVSFYKQDKKEGFSLLHRFSNESVLKKEELPNDTLALIEQQYPPASIPEFQQDELSFINRSVQIRHGADTRMQPVLTFLLNVIFADRRFDRMVVAVDVSQDFLRRILQRSEIAEVFLVAKGGKLLSHSKLEPTVKFAKTRFPHPIVERLNLESSPTESVELNVDGEPYLCNLADTGFSGLYIVSQTEKKKAFLALQTLVHNSLILATVIVWIVVILSIVFAGRLTLNIRKLKSAAEQVGEGNLDVQLDIHSNDELRDVGNSFSWMTKRIIELIEESRQKGRMEHELKTAKLVQTSLLQPPSLRNDAVDVAGYYSPMSECGGDLWDGWIRGNKLTLLVADATGHGAAAAIATAVAKSSIETLNAIFRNKELPCQDAVAAYNYIMHSFVQGRRIDDNVFIAIGSHHWRSHHLFSRARSTHSHAHHEWQETSQATPRPRAVHAGVDECKWGAFGVCSR